MALPAIFGAAPVRLNSLPAVVSQAPFVVIKFGGSSVGSAERVRSVVRLVRQAEASAPEARHVVVVSALGGVTDQLVAAIGEAERRSGAHRVILAELRERHAETLAALVPESERDAVETAPIFAELDELLQGIFLLRDATPRFRDAVISAGERLSVPIIAAAFRADGRRARPVDARALIRTDDAFGEATVEMATTRRLVREALLPESEALPIVTGFLGSTEDGVTTTLGRSGSDYTATLLGAALDAREVVIWTDVDGVLSADPRLVPEAFSLDRLSYREAAELAHFGAKVLHPRTMRPLEAAEIPLRIVNTMNPEAAGTRVNAEPPDDDAPPVRALTVVRDAALVTLEGAGLLGVPDLTATAFRALAEAQVPVLLVAQASSEGSLCLAVRAQDAPTARRALERTFAGALGRGDLRAVLVKPSLALVAAVGAGLHDATGLAGRMFATLGRAHVPVRAIAEGASDHNLSCVVDDADAVRAVQALHEAFALRRLRAHVVVIGAGTVGERLLTMLGEQAEVLCDEHRLHLRLLAVADSRRLVWEEGGISFAEALDRLDEQDPSESTLDRLTDCIRESRLERVIVVDATPSAEAARRYPAWLRQGAAVVTPNQKAFTFEPEFLDDLREAARESEAPFLYETTVGAGLSVLATLRDLRRTGDRVRRVEGVLSGTLAFVFAALREGRLFSEAVREAAERGYTETDPRADLSGEDVRRKLLILAREMGLGIEPAAVRVQSLVPEPLREISVERFWERLPELDSFWATKRAEFEGRGQQLQYVAVLSDEMVRAGVQALPAEQPAVRLSGATIRFAFHTERYGAEPLAVQGPGANADVTTAVLLADIVRAAEAMR